MYRFKLSILAFAMVSFLACQNKQKADYKEVSEAAVAEMAADSAKAKPSKDDPTFDFGGKDKQIVELGSIMQGDSIEHTYEFTNIGKKPLKIDYCNASCGCTVPTWPKEPIAPGAKGKIRVVFDSKNKEGQLFKNVSIYANTNPNLTTIGFNIEVKKK